MTAADRIIERLDGVRAAGAGRWMARCPAHEDRRASLSVRDADGRVLLCCHAGCSAGDVVAAVGLELRDLFDAPLEHSAVPVRDPLRPRVNASEALASIYHDALVMVIIAEQLARGEPLTGEHHKRLIRAAATIGNTVEHAVRAEPPELRRLRRGEGNPR